MTSPDMASLRERLELDACVAAHRQVLVLMATLVAQDEGRHRAMVEAINQRLSFHDAHEDPGLEADTAFAFERRVDLELRRILEDVERALRSKASGPRA